MAYWTVPGFSQMSLQGLFDRAAKHINSTRKPSVKPGTLSCVYGGNGCNASVFLREEHRAEADALDDPSWVGLVYDGYVPSTNSLFVADLQAAHDDATEDVARNDTDTFIKAYVENMHKLAKHHNLDPKVLKRFAK